MAHLLPYLNFSGTAREAMTFYHQALGGELTIDTYGEFGAAPEGHPAFDKVMHSQIIAGDFRLMASDHVPGFGPDIKFHASNNFAVAMVGPEQEQLTILFEQLSDGGTIETPLAQQMWGDSYGAFTDKFGTPWMFNIVLPK